MIQKTIRLFAFISCINSDCSSVNAFNSYGTHTLCSNLNKKNNIPVKRICSSQLSRAMTIPTDIDTVTLSSTRSKNSINKKTMTSLIPVGKGDEMILIRPMESKDLKRASTILTDSFFSFNIFSTPLEWLKTYLSLELSLNQTNELYFIMVSCTKRNTNRNIFQSTKVTNSEDVNQYDEITGMCEIDYRPAKRSGTSTPMSKKSKPNITPLPYICNLAVDEKWRRKGIGKTLMEVCEDIVQDEWEENVVHLRVRKNNRSAMEFYKNLGYSVYQDELEENSNPTFDKITGDEIILLKKEFTR